jgi:hypothetical protein
MLATSRTKLLIRWRLAFESLQAATSSFHLHCGEHAEVIGKVTNNLCKSVPILPSRSIGETSTASIQFRS